MQDLPGGVFINFGTAVTGPEVFLKALSMARNVARQRGESIRGFTTAVFDLMRPAGRLARRAAVEGAAAYYFRPWKTILARTVAGGGRAITSAATTGRPCLRCGTG